ncbi:hypothetical protein BWQ96_04170 [Gracilariopsis chorda]|uniref:Uncharacterized protein n=1 Tax=Gracilariopsis chorda TaxID=448386 RepID=A0A2V3IY61_9FLOR|nr:hypothetical protein BWQ96_04170 [Gracilariopsis chorda]|eukprot:PXF46070.1 hypothetical protein BWQ96_04170 [Gracilariopsis chorda]
MATPYIVEKRHAVHEDTPALTTLLPREAYIDNSTLVLVTKTEGCVNRKSHGIVRYPPLEPGVALALNLSPPDALIPFEKISLSGQTCSHEDLHEVLALYDRQRLLSLISVANQGLGGVELDISEGSVEDDPKSCVHALSVPRSKSQNACLYDRRLLHIPKSAKEPANKDDPRPSPEKDDDSTAENEEKNSGSESVSGPERANTFWVASDEAQNLEEQEALKSEDKCFPGSAIVQLENRHRIPMSDVRIGQQQVQRSDGRVSFITAVSTVRDSGLYNPQMLQGEIVVDNIRVSSYTDAVKPHIAHSMLDSLHAVFDRFGFYVTGLENGGGTVHSTIQKLTPSVFIR